MPLSISYSHALSDPTYCDAGKEGGLKITKKLGIAPNEPVPLKDILQFVTVAELLWCLRVVKPNMKSYADVIAWTFIDKALDTAYYAFWLRAQDYVRARVASSNVPRNREVLLDEATALYSKTVLDKDAQEWQALIAIFQDASPSQIAINVSDRMIKAKAFDGQAGLEESRQRLILQELLND